MMSNGLHMKILELSVLNISKNQKKRRISGILALITELKKIVNFDPITEKSSKLDYVKDILEENYFWKRR